MQSSALAAVFVALALVADVALAGGPTNAAYANSIAVSPDVATGVFIGIFLLSILIFALKMLDGVKASDKIGQNKPELTR